MAKFDVKNYKLNDTKLSRLNRLSTKHLGEVLSYWSRIGNQRARRIEKQYEDKSSKYSALYMYDYGGKFGRHQAYMDRESMLNELTRIKEVGTRLTQKKVNEEERQFRDVVNNVQSTFGSEGSISETKFKMAFVIFKNRYYMVEPDFYNQIKDAITKMKDKKYLYEIADLIDRLYSEWSMQKLREQPDSSNPFSPNQVDKLSL